MEWKRSEKISSVSENNKISRTFAIFKRLLISSSLILMPYTLESIEHKWPCPKNTRPTFFGLRAGEVCRGERTGDSCFECRKVDPEEFVYNNFKLEKLVEKVENGKENNVSIGKKYTPEESERIKNELKKWSNTELEMLIKELNGNLTEEERKIFRGALEHWPEIKFHAMRLKIDPRIAYLVAIAESRFIQKIGKAGEVSPMQILPSTMNLMYRMYGKDDPYIGANRNWRYDTTSQIILALYYLRDGIRTVASDGAMIENISPLDLLLVYHFYNKGHNKFIIPDWWQGENFANCVEKYLPLYPKIEKFIKEFLKRTDGEENNVKKPQKTNNVGNRLSNEMKRYSDMMQKAQNRTNEGRK
ncbi:MAG: lytic transglycosylase domain-containing protein [Candidatus Micrarchaeota archaeon]|nr:lytic transglycosylase domain-containing protein [Candidatus Micrarchaeota archaeon]